MMIRSSKSADKIFAICHPYGGSPVGNAKKVCDICRELANAGCLPLAPQLLLPNFLDDRTDRDLAMSMCMRLVSVVEELWVFGSPTEGMLLEMGEARRLGIPVIEQENC